VNLKIPGVDPIVLQRVQERTRRQAVHEFREGKIEDRRQEGQQESGSEHSKPRLQEIVAELNRLMEEAGHELYFEVVQTGGQVMVQVRYRHDGSLLKELAPSQLLAARGQLDRLIGLLINESV